MRTHDVSQAAESSIVKFRDCGGEGTLAYWCSGGKHLTMQRAAIKDAMSQTVVNGGGSFRIGCVVRI